MLHVPTSRKSQIFRPASVARRDNSPSAIGRAPARRGLRERRPTGPLCCGKRRSNSSLGSTIDSASSAPWVGMVIGYASPARAGPVANDWNDSRRGSAGRGVQWPAMRFATLACHTRTPPVGPLRRGSPFAAPVGGAESRGRGLRGGRSSRAEARRKCHPSRKVDGSAVSWSSAARGDEPAERGFRRAIESARDRGVDAPEPALEWRAASSGICPSSVAAITSALRGGAVTGGDDGSAESVRLTGSGGGRG